MGRENSAHRRSHMGYLGARVLPTPPHTRQGPVVTVILAPQASGGWSSWNLPSKGPIFPPDPGAFFWRLLLDSTTTHKAAQLRAHAGQPAESWWMNMLRQWKTYHWVGRSSPRHLLTVPTVWLPADSDDPPTILRLMMLHKHIHPKGGVKRFILYIIEGSSEASQAGPKWLETARKGGWTGFLLWLGWDWWESPHMQAGACVVRIFWCHQEGWH